MGAKIEKLTQKLKILMPEIRTRYRAEITGLFGSYIRNEEKPDSDLDVLVRFLPKANMLDMVGLSMFLEKKLGIKTDVVPEDAVREELREEIIEGAVTL